MKILALYSSRTLTAFRRVIAPFSVLSNRGYSFSFMEVSSFHASYGVGYDITVLPNWILNEEERVDLHHQVAQGTCFSYDLADPKLLQFEEVLDTLRSCALITVPTDYLAKEVRIAVPGKKVVVLPSTIDIPYLMYAHTYPRPDRLCVGCFGPFDWSQLKEVLQSFHDTEASLTFLGDEHAVRDLGNLVQPVKTDFEYYPAALRQCAFGLMPIATQTGRDTIWEHEYGIFNKPVLSLSMDQTRGNIPANREKWIEAIKSFANHPEKRAQAGARAHERSKEVTAVRLADQYEHAYRKILPQLTALRYTSIS